jgi:hypothetical protein
MNGRLCFPLTTATLAVIAFGSLANAVWMLLAPLHWHANLPAQVPDFGPPNAHFIRDVGCAYLGTGVALAWAVFTPRLRFPLAAVVTLFYVAHALTHVFDTAWGHVPPSHWWVDLPTIYLPALLLSGVTLATRRSSGCRSP